MLQYLWRYIFARFCTKSADTGKRHAALLCVMHLLMHEQPFCVRVFLTSALPMTKIKNVFSHKFYCCIFYICYCYAKINDIKLNFKEISYEPHR